MPHPELVARRMFELVEPIGMIPFIADEPNETLMALGLRNYWDTYFAGRAAPFGAGAPAELIHAVFYNFAPGEVARHIPQIWNITTPELALAARLDGCTAGLRRILGNMADDPCVARSAELLTKAAASAPIEGRPLFAALRTVPIPDEPVAKLWHAATLLREQRGDGHVVSLVAEGIGGTECHVLHSLAQNLPAQDFGRVWHLPAEQLRAVIDGMRQRGLIGEDGWLTEAGRAAKQRVEAMTDRLAEAPYDALTSAELAQLMIDLAPIAELINAASPWG